MRDVVGALVLAILAGGRRYWHIGRFRNDMAGVELLGLGRIVSDESARHTLKKNCPEERLDEWLSRHEREVTEPLLQFPYVLDVDNTVKPLFGSQEGASRECVVTTIRLGGWTAVIRRTLACVGARSHPTTTTYNRGI